MRRSLFGLLIGAGTLVLLANQMEAPPAVPRPDATASACTLPPFGPVTVRRPVGEPKGVALLLSDADGVSATETGIADSLARQGILSAAVSSPQLLREVDSGKGCLNLNYPLVALSNDVQHRMGVRIYQKPVIVGVGIGGTLAYASLSQWARGSYAGVVSVGHAPELPTRTAWCTAPGFTAERDKDAKGWRFGANPQIALPWAMLQPGKADAATRHLVSGVPGALLTAIPVDPRQWDAPISRSVAAMLPRHLTRAQTGPLPVPDMPLTLVPARSVPATAGLMAIVYSGDGGWVGLDRELGTALAAQGIPVVGVDSLSYFWTARTPEGASRDLAQLIAAFSQHWGRPRILLVGYSFGADVLPHMVDRLDPTARAKIERLSLLGLGSTGDFQFHLSSWLDISSANALPTVPAVERLKGLPIQCIRGEDEGDSACPALPQGIAQQYLVPGGHHFDRNAALLASIILERRRPGTVSD